MKITEVRVSLCNEERLKAFVNITFDDEFVVRGRKVIEGHNGFFVSMPSRRRSDGTYQDIAMRTMLEETVLKAYGDQLQLARDRGDAVDEPTPEPKSEADDETEHQP